MAQLKIAKAGYPIALDLKADRRTENRMRYVDIAGLDKPVARVALGTEDYFLTEFDYRAQILDSYLAGGGNAIDTARGYATRNGVANSELVVGKWMAERGNRQEVVIITKGVHPPSGQALGRMSEEEIGLDSSDSLAALAVESIDIWLFHRDNPNVEVAAIMNWINAHVDADRIKVFGASNWSLDRYEAANAYAAANGLAGFALLSNHFGLATQQAPRWPGCRNVDPAERAQLLATGKPNLAWSAQCGGFFAGIYDPAERSNTQMVNTYYDDENFARLERARQLSAQLGISPVQVALAYTLSQDFDSMGVFWSANQRELNETLTAVDIVLDAGQRAFLEGANA